jgi:mercuric ion binding protein
MKRLAIAAAGTLALAFTGFAIAAAPASRPPAHVRTATFSVANMTCATCPISVKTAMQKVGGVQAVTVSLEKKTATVVFDPSRVKPAAIAAASSAVGFPATLAR